MSPRTNVLRNCDKKAFELYRIQVANDIVYHLEQREFREFRTLHLHIRPGLVLSSPAIETIVVGRRHFWLFFLPGQISIYHVHTLHIDSQVVLGVANVHHTLHITYILYVCIHVLQAARNDKGPPTKKYDSDISS